jgi:predicted RNA-binding protein with PIN domain
MPYLIDGHNLVPKLGFNLQDPDDEQQLIDLLQLFCRVRQTQVEIYFDGGNPGHPSQRKVGRVTAHFVRKGTIADSAIEARLLRLGNAARNWSVVSSDHRVQSAAREVHARVFSSDEFASQVADARLVQSIQGKTDANLSPGEVDEWMDLFKDKKKQE